MLWDVGILHNQPPIHILIPNMIFSTSGNRISRPVQAGELELLQENLQLAAQSDDMVVFAKKQHIVTLVKMA